MVTLYGYTILADMALLAIVIAIFVFAVTIYKGASELCIKEQRNAADRRKELIESRKKELTNKLPVINGRAFSSEVRAELDNLDNEIRKINKSVLKTIKKAKSLTARNLVFVPSSLLIASIIGSGIAIAISGTLQSIMWVLSLFLLVASLYFGCSNIRAIAFFSSFIDFSTLMEQALEKHADKLKPVVDMKIWDFTLVIKHGKTEKVAYHVFLKHGSIGRNIEVRFVGTDELDFPEETAKPLEVNKENMINPKYFEHKLGDLNRNANRANNFKVKAPDQPGEYTMTYWLLCDEYTGDETTFKIKVV